MTIREESSDEQHELSSTIWTMGKSKLEILSFRHLRSGDESMCLHLGWMQHSICICIGVGLIPSPLEHIYL